MEQKNILEVIDELGKLLSCNNKINIEEHKIQGLNNIICRIENKHK